MQSNHSCVPVFSNPSSGPPFAWPGNNWDWIPQACWLAPDRVYWICGSYLWVWLPPGWIGRRTLGLAFTLGFIFSEVPEKPTNLPNLKTHGAKCVFHWCDYLAAIVHSSILAWKIPWTEKPDRLQSMGSQRVGHD